MKTGGIVLTLLGVGIALIAFLLPTSVDTGVPDIGLLSTGSSSYATSTPVVNLGLLQRQTLVFGSGAVLTLAGVIFTAAAFIIEAIGSAMPVAVREAPGAALVEAQESSAEEEEAAQPLTPGPPSQAVDDDKFGIISVAIGAVILVVCVVYFFLFIPR